MHLFIDYKHKQFSCKKTRAEATRDKNARKIVALIKKQEMCLCVRVCVCVCGGGGSRAILFSQDHQLVAIIHRRTQYISTCTVPRHNRSDQRFRKGMSSPLSSVIASRSNKSLSYVS